jgi:hypothetical protein
MLVRGCVALLYRCTVVRRETPLALSRHPPGLLPKSVVGWITHHTPDVGVLKPILPATFSDLYDPGQVIRSRRGHLGAILDHYLHWATVGT